MRKIEQNTLPARKRREGIKNRVRGNAFKGPKREGTTFLQIKKKSLSLKKWQ
jgi:hypothetical protein